MKCVARAVFLVAGTTVPGSAMMIASCSKSIIAAIQWKFPMLHGNSSLFIPLLKAKKCAVDLGVVGKTQMA